MCGRSVSGVWEAEGRSVDLSRCSAWASAGQETPPVPPTGLRRLQPHPCPSPPLWGYLPEASVAHTQPQVSQGSSPSTCSSLLPRPCLLPRAQASSAEEREPRLSVGLWPVQYLMGCRDCASKATLGPRPTSCVRSTSDNNLHLRQENQGPDKGGSTWCGWYTSPGLLTPRPVLLLI